MTRKPSCLISCSHRSPEGNLSVFCGKARRDEAGREGTLQTCGINKVAQCLLQLGDKPVVGHEMSEGTMSDGFDDLAATEKAGIGAALYRCRALTAKIANELRNKRPEHFVDRLSLADIHASLERAADVLSGVKSRAGSR